MQAASIQQVDKLLAAAAGVRARAALDTHDAYGFRRRR